MRQNEQEMDEVAGFVHKLMGYVGDESGHGGEEGSGSYKVAWQDLCLFSFFLEPKSSTKNEDDEGGFSNACHFHIFDTSQQQSSKMAKKNNSKS